MRHAPCLEGAAMQLGRLGIAEMPATASRARDDYAVVRRAITFLTTPHGRQPSAVDLAAYLEVGTAELQQVLARWCGLCPTAFARALSAEHIRGLLAASDGVLGSKLAGGRDRIHAFDVRIAATISDDARRRGAGLDIAYGVQPCPFGQALITMSEGGVCGLAFVDEDSGESRRAALEDMRGRWPNAHFREAPEEIHAAAARIFSASPPSGEEAVPLTLIGTSFDLKVWQTLLCIPIGALVSYTDIARHIGQPNASRAVGTANGRNPISFVVPCHRALRGDGTLGGYYWGLTRKRALIAWEAGHLRTQRTEIDQHSEMGGD